MKQDDRFTCGACGIEVTVTVPCKEENCDMICCGQAMKLNPLASRIRK